MEKEKKQVTIYTDGACSGNPGNGGWGAILMYNGRKKRFLLASKTQPITAWN